MVSHMDKHERAQKRQDAVLAQLQAEIAANGHTMKSLAAEVSKDYLTFRRYVKGERPMPMNVYWDTLDALGIPEEVFIARVRERFESSN